MLKETPVPSLITEGTTVKGELNFCAPVVVQGTVEGILWQDSPYQLQVGHNGWVRGSIHSKGPVVISGRVEGDVFSSCSIRLTATASVKGCISAPSIELRPGALLDGELNMTGEYTSQQYRIAA